MKWSQLARQVVDGFAQIDFGALTKSFQVGPDNPASAPEAKAQDVFSKDEWSPGDLRRALQLLSLSDRRLTNPPQTISLDGLAGVMYRLAERAVDGKEYGRFGFTRLGDGQFEMGKTYQGTEHECTIANVLPNGTVPSRRTHRLTVMLHTHGAAKFGRDPVCYHFSPQDFKSFLSNRDVQLSIVLASGLKLMLCKTDRTPVYTEQIGAAIDRWLVAADMDLSVKPLHRMRRFTREVAKRLDLALYRVVDAEHPTRAKLVDLK